MDEQLQDPIGPSAVAPEEPATPEALAAVLVDQAVPAGAEQLDETQAPAFVEKVKGPNPTTKLTLEVYLSQNEGFQIDESENAPENTVIPALRTAEANDRLTEGAPVTNVDSEAGALWNEIRLKAARVSVSRGGLEGALDRPEASYLQYLETPKGKMGYTSPKFGDDGPLLSGQKAILKVRALLGRGGIRTIPLFHSGFWVSIRTPAESELIELLRRVQEEKIALGRMTHGLIFSNTSAFITSWLLNLVEAHVVESTLKDQTSTIAHIKMPDLPVLFWGLATSIWPAGFQYSRSIMTEDGKANKKIISGLIDVGKLLWVDNNALTDWQKAHMSNRTPGSMPLDSIKKYQDEFVSFKGRRVTMKPGIDIELTVPDAMEYVRSGQAWVNSIVSMVEFALAGKDEDRDARNAAVMQHAQATSLRQYGHCIKSIHLGELDNTQSIVDRESIEETLAVFSEDPDIRKKYAEEMKRFNNDITVAVIAVPEASGKETGLPRFPHLIPMDVVSTFFTLLMQRVSRIDDR